MNISTAAVYAKQGCKVRRAAWEKNQYLECLSGIIVESGGYTYLPDLDDLLEEDWEIVQQ